MAQQRYSRRHQALMAILIEARAAIGKTQRKVSADMKKSPGFAHLVESGERMLSVLELPEYASAVGLTPIEVMSRTLELERSGYPIVIRRRRRS